MNGFQDFNEFFPYRESDTLIRAIRDSYIRSDGTIKLQAFRCNKGGVSVTRANDSNLDLALDFVKSKLEGKMGTFPRRTCDDVNIYCESTPSTSNKHHCDLYGSATRNELSVSQIEHIINNITLK